MIYWFGWIILLAGSILVFRLFVHRDYQQNGKLSWFSAFLETLVFASHANLYYLYLPVPWPQLPPLPDQGFLSIVWLGLMILGGILTLGFMAFLGIKKSLGQSSKALRQTGPYRWSRNPQILAYYLVIICFALLYPSLESAGWVLLYAIIAHIMVRTEEEHLLNVFGITYQEYCERVPRYFLFF
jgi:protein-S-isoprenylcysteine O-methyltransferase Ste14